MTAMVLQAAVGAGKTEAALERLTKTITDKRRPFARVWVLLATKRQEVAFRQRLVDLNLAHPVHFNVESFNFYELNTRLLHLAGSPQRQLRESARLGIVRHILTQLVDEGKLHLFANIAGTSGFVRVVADLIYELKQNQVYPEQFEAAVQTRKDHELSLIYERYQSLLQEKDLVDREGEGWLALEMARNFPTLATNVDLLVVDGYDQFTNVQAAMLAELARQVKETVITLTTVPGRENTIGRRFAMALQRLQDAFVQLNVSLEIQTIKVLPPRHAELYTLSANLFNDDAKPYPPHEAESRVRLLEAPEPAEEVAAVLREVKRLLLDDTSPDDILIAIRDWKRYYAHFVTYGALYKLPLLLHYNEPIAQSPAVLALLSVLDLTLGATQGKGFRRLDVLEALRSPYFDVPGITTDNVDKLDRISVEKQVLGGRDHWLRAIDSASEEYDDEDGNAMAALLDVHEAVEMSTNLETFFDQIAPPATNSILGFVRWLDQLIGADPLREEVADPETRPLADVYSLNMPARIRQTEVDEWVISRDIAALNTLKDLLRGFVQTDELLHSVGASLATVTWEMFYADLKSAISGLAQPQRAPIRSGRVLVTTAADARGLPHPHVFIPGMSEGVFPAPTPEDPLYLDNERTRLTNAGALLETAGERAADDGLFYELVSLPRQSLTLSRPTVRDGKPWVESHLWRMVKAVFKRDSLTLRRYRIGQVVPAEEVAALDEAVLVVADGLDEAQPAATILGLYRWLTARDSAWEHVAHGQRIENRRLSRRHDDAYGGRLQQPAALEIAAVELADNRKWSASQLNEFGRCGFHFFAKRLLRLEAADEPETGLDQLQLGTLNHSILEATYNQIQAENLTITPSNRAYALQVLESEAAHVFVDAPRKLGFLPSPQWAREQTMLLRRLIGLVELDFSDESPLNTFGTNRQVYRCEHRFDIAIPIGDQVQKIHVRGSIDRIDKIGNRLVIMDYKSGSSPISTKAMEEGRNFQMMVYLLALDTWLIQKGYQQRVVGGAFWHVRSRAISGDLRLTSSDDTFIMRVIENPSIREAQRHIERYVLYARNGDFSMQPIKPEGGRCSNYCDFYQLCRVSATGHKAQG